MLSTGDSLQIQDAYKPKVKGWKKIFHPDDKQKKAEMTILTLDKTDFKSKLSQDKKKLHNDKTVNSTGRQNNCKYICTQNQNA